MLGSELLSTQWILLWAGAATLLTGAWARIQGQGTRGSERALRVQAIVLLFGLLFLGLVFLQARNPTLRVALKGNLWQLVPLTEAGPGPHSLLAPFDRIPGDWLPYRNAWRYLLIYGAAWLYAAGMALGLLNRVDTLRWLRLVAVNAAVLSVVCIAHRLSGSRQTLWNFADTFDFTGSPVFFYKNHNGAYLAASLAAVLACAAADGETPRRRIWEGVALVTWIATITVNSRVAIGCATLWMLFYLGWRLRVARGAGERVFTGKRVVIALAASLVIGGAVAYVDGGRALKRFSPAWESPVDFLQGGHFRTLTRQVGIEMWKEQPAWGWGGGSYMYLFNTYHSLVPEVQQWVYREQPNLNRFVQPGLNCDWIEFLVEYGVIGVGLLVIALAVALGACARWWPGAPTASGFVIAGIAGILLHAYFDYVLRNPAILQLMLGLLIVAVRLSVNKRAHRGRQRWARPAEPNRPTRAVAG